MKINNHFKEDKINKPAPKKERTPGAWYLLVGITLAVLGPSVVNFL